MKLLFLGDLHIGSNVALSHPEDKSRIGQPVRDALYDVWEQESKGEWKSPDVLVVNGDAIEGQDKKSNGKSVWTTDLMDQVYRCRDLIKMWDPGMIYIVRGSNYHVAAGDTGLMAEDLLGKELNAKSWPKQDNIQPENRQKSGWHLYLTADDVTFHVSHHIGVSRVFHYRSTPIAREMLNAKLNDALRHTMPNQKTEIVIRSHAHYYWHCEAGSQHGWVLPCWKGQDDFLSKSPTSISPDIGYVGFEVKGKRFEYDKRLWSLEDVQAPPHVVYKGERKSGRDNKNTGLDKNTARKSRAKN